MYRPVCVYIKTGFPTKTDSPAKTTRTRSSVVPCYLVGAVVYYVGGDAPVEDQNALTRSPLELTFEPAQCGLTVSLAARRQNRRGELGPWSEIVSVIIP
ncbi:MAG: hypothetical protein LBJ23_06740 [Tannerella sp.]|nr:hypothetical protein [Tannerella sp.]